MHISKYSTTHIFKNSTMHIFLPRVKQLHCDLPTMLNNKLSEFMKLTSDTVKMVCSGGFILQDESSIDAEFVSGALFARFLDESDAVSSAVSSIPAEHLVKYLSALQILQIIKRQGR